VLNHPSATMTVVEVCDNFVITMEFNENKNFFPKYDAIPKNRIVESENFFCKNESDVKHKLSAILGKK
jgi:hypothetical protein